MIMPAHLNVSAGITALVVATDQSADAAAVVRAAAAIAGRTGARIHVVHRADSSAPDQGMERLDELLHAELPRGQPAASKLVTDNSGEAMVEAAAEHWADLIILGAEQARTLTRASGRIADRVACTAACSCLVVNAELDLPLHRVLVATGIDSLHSGALDEAFHWAQLLGDPELGTELIVLTVVPDASRLDEERIAQQLDEKISVAHAAALAPEWITTGRRVACNASVPRAITDAATRETVQLMVVGKHSRSRLRRSLIGSVAAAVIASATQPVLLVPPALCIE